MVHETPLLQREETIAGARLNRPHVNSFNAGSREAILAFYSELATGDAAGTIGKGAHLRIGFQSNYI